jgi:hypothetical protein
MATQAETINSYNATKAELQVRLDGLLATARTQSSEVFRYEDQLDVVERNIERLPPADPQRILLEQEADALDRQISSSRQALTQTNNQITETQNNIRYVDDQILKEVARPPGSGNEVPLNTPNEPASQAAQEQAQNTVPGSSVATPPPATQPDPYEVDGAGAGDIAEEDIQAQDNPIDQPSPYTQTDPGEVPDSEFLGGTPDGVSPYGEEDDPVDFSVADANDTPQPDPYEVDGAGAGDISEEDIQAQDNPTAQPDPYEVDGAETSAAGLSEEGRQAEDNPVDDDPAYPQTDPGETPTNTESLADVQALQEEQAAAQQAAVDRARAQAVLQQQRKQANDGDWRVKLRLAPLSTYLYNAASPGILQPLKDTDGVVFPYTPQISTAYTAKYTPYDLTHSNYRGYFYQGSAVEEISIECPFTAQDTKEAEYLLAVIHFFRSATKMFYGQDAERGTPPPLVYLQGLGEYQFNLHPCVITSFNYNLPADVDYIRARSPNISSTGLLQKRIRQTTTTGPFDAVTQRLSSINAQPGAVATPPAPPTLGTNSPTYVPTRLEVSIRLLPIQTREQVSKQFSLKQFANGDLIKGGFW